MEKHDGVETIVEYKGRWFQGFLIDVIVRSCASRLRPNGDPISTPDSKTVSWVGDVAC